MPWKEISVVEQRLQFIAYWMKGEHSVAELARQFGISRKTAYKLIDRWQREEALGLADRSRRPRTSPNATPEDIRRRILEKRAQKPTWGPEKLLASLRAENIAPLPAISTTAAILKRHGLAAPRKCRRHATPSPALIEATSPNQLWCTDFKGWFRVGTGERCDPLTVIDSYSRYLLCCRGFYKFPNTETIKHVYRELFARHGLPSYILSDNGAPFASIGLGGLSRLSVWWVCLGITPLRIVPGKPQQNGRLERFHRTLKQETAQPPAPTAKAQSKRFETFFQEYNHERPHQALGNTPPSQHYHNSSRSYLGGDPPPYDYGDEFETRNVTSTGIIYWAGKKIHLSSTLAGQVVGLKLQEDAPLAMLYLGQHQLGLIDLKKGVTLPMAQQVRLIRLTHPPGGESSALHDDRNPTDTTALHPILPVLPMSLE